MSSVSSPRVPVLDAEVEAVEAVESVDCWRIIEVEAMDEEVYMSSLADAGEMGVGGALPW